VEGTIVYALQMVNLLKLIDCLLSFYLQSLFIVAAYEYCLFTSYINFLFRVLEEEFLKAFKYNTGLKTKVNNFHHQLTPDKKLDEDFVAIRPEWTMVDRIIACRFSY
jgi:hypothetical protein